MGSRQWKVGDMSGGGNAPVVGVAGLNKSGRSQCLHASFSFLLPTRSPSSPSPSFGKATSLSALPLGWGDRNLAAMTAMNAQAIPQQK